MRHFIGHFLFENWPLPTFDIELVRNREVFAREKSQKWRKNWPFAHFLPTFIFKSGQAETVGAQGFAGFLATFPLFYLHLNAKKMLKIIYK